MRKNISMIGLYQFGARLFARRTEHFAALGDFGRQTFALALYAAWLVGEAAAALFLLARGAHPLLALGLLFALDVAGRGVFRAGKRTPQARLEWVRRDYIENVKKTPRFLWLILLGLILFGSFYSAARAQAGWTKHQSPTADTLHNAFFASEKKGWAIAHRTGLVLRTEDGGRRWQIRARLGEGYLETIFFLDKKTGWIAGERGRVFQTSDGGANWKAIGSFAPSNAFSAVHFFDEERGFLFGIDTEKRAGVVFETRDGGRRWTDRSAELAGRTTLSDAIFRFGDRSFLVGGSAFLRGEKGKSGFEIIEHKHGGPLRGLFFAGPQTGWAIGHRGLILRTSDGGKSWEKRESFTATILRSLNFKDEKTGFIVGNRDEAGISMWQTNDRGRSWQAVREDFPDLHRIVATRKKLWLLGAAGAIYSTEKK